YVLRQVNEERVKPTVDLEHEAGGAAPGLFGAGRKLHQCFLVGARHKWGGLLERKALDRPSNGERLSDLPHRNVDDAHALAVRVLNETVTTEDAHRLPHGSWANPKALGNPYLIQSLTGFQLACEYLV